MCPNVEIIVNGQWQENCYILSNSRNQGLIVDPGNEADRILDYLGAKNITPLAILNTHAHYDHIGAVLKIQERLAIPFFLHSKDEGLLNRANMYGLFFNHGGRIDIPRIDYYLDKIDTPVVIGDFSIQVFFTPGHTKGSVCFLIGNYLLTGDTLFNGSIGRVDLPDGNESDLLVSLKRISQLPQQAIVHPGHGRASVLEYEMKNNNNFMEAIQSVQLSEA